MIYKNHFLLLHSRPLLEVGEWSARGQIKPVCYERGRVYEWARRFKTKAEADAYTLKQMRGIMDSGDF